MAEYSPASLVRNANKRYAYLGKLGKVVSFSSIAIAPNGMRRHVPYIVAVVDFGDKRVTMQLAGLGANEVKVGMKVLGVLRRMVEPTEDGVIVYGVKGIAVKQE